MIVVIGEALIDLIENREKPGQFQAVVGGANANVAIALARRGTNQQFLARISKDPFGLKIRQHLIDNAVGLDHAISANQPSSIAIASINSSGGARYSFYLNGTADWDWSRAELPDIETLKNIGASALHFGCLTMTLPPGSQVIKSWAEEIFARDMLTISHDVNVRPALGLEARDEKQRVAALNEISHLIKASDDDIKFLYGEGSESSIDQIVADWIKDSGKVVFITKGGEGVSIYRRGGVRLEVAARPTKVKDTVGAGDTFCATTLGQLSDLGALGANPLAKLSELSDQVLIELAKVSATAASLACEKTGAEPPTLKELEAALKAS
jgi:fructokinase